MVQKIIENLVPLVWVLHLGVFYLKKMAGQLGNKIATIQKLKFIEINLERSTNGKGMTGSLICSNVVVLIDTNRGTVKFMWYGAGPARPKCPQHAHIHHLEHFGRISS